MSTLADEFLKDFEKADDDPLVDDIDLNELDRGDPFSNNDVSNRDDVMEAEIAQAFKRKREKQLEQEAFIEMPKSKALDEIVSFAKSQELQAYLEEIDSFMKQELNRNLVNGTVISIEEDPEYAVIVKGNQIVSQLLADVQMSHRYLRDIYTQRWPELEQLVPNALDYARCIKQIGNDLVLARAELTNILPSASIISLSVAATTTSGKPLSDEDLQKAFEACDMILSLDETQLKVIQYIESRMNFFAPNLSFVLGSEIAAKLIGFAGGISSLARMVSGSIQALGIAKKGSVNGMSTATTITHFGYLIESDLVRNSPPSIQTRVCRLVSGKAALAARVDSFRSCPGGEVGAKLRAEIEHKIEVWQEPPPLKKEKPLALPDLKPRSRRGGRRARKLKQNYALTELRKRANRMTFGSIKDDVDNDMGRDLGMLGEQSGSGLLRISINYDGKGFRVKTAKPNKSKGAATTILSTVAVDVVSGAPKSCGLATSIYTNPKMMDVSNNANPLQAKIMHLKKQHEGYFSAISGFTSVIKR